MTSTSVPVISLHDTRVYEYDEVFDRANVISAEFDRLFHTSYSSGFYVTDVKDDVFTKTLTPEDWQTYYNNTFSEVALYYEVKHRCGNVDLVVRYEKPKMNVYRYEFHSWFGFGVNATKTGMAYDANKVIHVFPKFTVIPIADVRKNILAELRRKDIDEVEKNRNILRLFVCGGYANKITAINEFAKFLELADTDVEALLHS